MNQTEAGQAEAGQSEEAARVDEAERLRRWRLLLVHDRDLLGVLDGWVASLDADEFLEVLPLLRRTFGEFSAPERASIGRAVRSLPAGTDFAAGAADADGIDYARAEGAVAAVAAILACWSAPADKRGAA